MSEPRANVDLPLAEQLVAYLDGELDGEETRRIEELLAADPEARRTLQRLDRTWHLLETLDAAAVGEPFTQSTLEMVTVAAADEVQRQQAEAPRRWRRRWLIAGGSLAAAGLAGFLAVTLLAGALDPNKPLIRDLPVLENLDQYCQVKDIQFLQMLSQEGIFVEEPGDGSWPETTRAEESSAERRRRIEKMSPAEKELLRQRQERFNNSAPAEQQRILKLHEDLERAPDGAQLRQVMQRYYEWLKAQPSYRQAEFVALDPKERLERIKKLFQEQAKIDARRLSPEDTKVLLQWMEDYAAKQEPGFLRTLRPESRQQLENQSDPSKHRQTVMWWSWQRWLMGSPGSLPPLSEADLEDLRSRLSPESRQRLEGLSSAEQRQMVAGWIHQETRNRWSSRRTQGKLPPIDEEELASFFENELSDDERDRLLSLSGDEIQKELRKMYRMRHGMLEPPPRPGDGPPGHFRRPGPPDGEWPYPRRPESEPPATRSER